MTNLLHIIASPRDAESKSNELARAHIAAERRANANLVVDTLDLWREPLPDFDGNSAAAKLKFFGVGELEGAKMSAWDVIVQIAQRFIEADHYVLSVPMWNGGVPYRLKQYIDIITQPGLLFGFDPANGYSGLLQNKRATVCYTSGVYAPGVDVSFGLDFHSTYIDWWLNFIGVSDIETVRFQPSLLTTDPAIAFQEAMADARQIAA